MTTQTKFLLLLGPSGCGKTTIIHELRRLDNRFIYISPYITRPLRDGEQDKIAITDEVMDAMDQAGEFLVINPIYGIRYGTPRTPILQAFVGGKFPVLDWPADRMDIMINAFTMDRLYVVYVAPPNLAELRKRLEKDGRDKDGTRLAAGVSELARYRAGDYDEIIHYRVVSTQDAIPQIAHSIYVRYLEDCGLR